jgi:hypothetical protein
MFYRKDFANCYEELKSYYPCFYNGILEMEAVMKASGALADGLEKGIETIFDDSFIDTADEETIMAIEKFLDLHLYKSRTLNGQLSASAIRQIVSSYTNSKVDVYFEPFDEAGNNKLYINYDRGSEETLYIAELDEILSRKIPAHIIYQSAMSYTFAIATKPKRRNYKKDFDLAGLKYEVGTLGLSVGSKTEVETAGGAASSISFNYTLCGTSYAHDN